ncbi:hypothetical protein J7E28_08760 [Microbacterium sp. ISL-108]|nr:hypothetical protein [Microbacterium sp. ISL-108]MBT2484790.1 hypothetical protein [Microbacterium sp. ISL-108]
MTMIDTAPTAPDTAEALLPVLEIPLSVAIQSAAAMLTSASKDDVTPVLTTAHFDGTHLNATDRYKVARFEMPTKPASEEGRLTLGEAFLIPRAALEWVTKITVKSLRQSGILSGLYTIRYERESDPRGEGYQNAPGTVTVSVVDHAGKTERSQAFDGVVGNFPPVARLFPENPDEEVTTGTQAFNPAYMGVILAYIAKYSDRGAPFRFRVAQSNAGHKLAPALITGAGASFLIQPHLILR